MNFRVNFHFMPTKSTTNTIKVSLAITSLIISLNLKCKTEAGSVLHLHLPDAFIQSDLQLH